jgi:hypothetical protein
LEFGKFRFNLKLKIQGIRHITTWERRVTQRIELPKALEGVPPEEHGRWCCARLEAGQFALEQTFIVGKNAQVLPEKAPVRVLERIAGCPLT